MMVSQLATDLGYSGLFAERETVTQAQDELTSSLWTSTNRAGILTAVQVRHNTFVSHLLDSYHVIEKSDTHYTILESIDETQRVIGIFSSREVAEDICRERETIEEYQDYIYEIVPMEF